MGLFSKKDKSGSSDAASDADRNALFGSKKGSPAPSNSNPYAQPAAPPPYSGGGLSDRVRAEKSPVPPGGYGNAGSSYGGGGAYGQDRFGGASGGAGGGTASRYGAGGYGGMGDSDAGRQELFGNAAQRAQQQPAGPPSGAGGTMGGGSSAAGGGYGSYADRQLTQEEEEEEDVQAAKQQIKFSKFLDVGGVVWGIEG